MFVLTSVETSPFDSGDLVNRRQSKIFHWPHSRVLSPWKELAITVCFL